MIISLSSKQANEDVFIAATTVCVLKYDKKKKKKIIMP